MMNSLATLLSIFALYSTLIVSNGQLADTNCRVPPGAAADNFAPNATNCDNELDNLSCSTLFPTTAAPATRDPNCIAAGYERLAVQCARQCGFCCLNEQVSCGNNPGN